MCYIVTELQFVETVQSTSFNIDLQITNTKSFHEHRYEFPSIIQGRKNLKCFLLISLTNLVFQIYRSTFTIYVAGSEYNGKEYFCLLNVYNQLHEN